MLNTREEILSAWRILGFHDGPSFTDYYKDRIQNGVKNEEELELLAPENVDLKLFWGMCDEFFAGSVCGLAKEPMDIGQQNWLNWSIATQMAVDANVRKVSKYANVINPIDILEIGPGYGCLVPELVKPFITYNAIDVHLRFRGVTQFDGYSIPDSVKTPETLCVISSNVFQHLSVSQRRGYYTQIRELLANNKDRFGYFDFNMNIIGPFSTGEGRFIKHNDKFYMCHMGMYTQVQELNDVLSDIFNARLALSVLSQRTDGLAGFSCYVDNRTQNPAPTP